MKKLMYLLVVGVMFAFTACSGGDDAKIGSAGLILAIGGGSLLPPLQGAIIDMPSFTIGDFVLSSTRASFCLPFICFLVIGYYGWNTKIDHT